MKIKVKMEVEFLYDTETGTAEMISSKQLSSKEESKSSSKSSKKVKEIDCAVKLEDNKLILSSNTISILNAEIGDRITIKYNKFDGQLLPCIAKDEVLGTKSGNKLTKSNTISFRGKANEQLSAYGDEFKLDPTTTEGIYKLIGNKEFKPYKEVDPNIKVEESDEDNDLFSGRSGMKKPALPLTRRAGFRYTGFSGSGSRLGARHNTLHLRRSELPA